MQRPRPLGTQSSFFLLWNPRVTAELEEDTEKLRRHLRQVHPSDAAVPEGPGAATGGRTEGSTNMDFTFSPRGVRRQRRVGNPISGLLPCLTPSAHPHPCMSKGKAQT